MQGSVRSIAKESALLAAGQYGAAALGLAATVMAARLLGPNDFGLVALVIAYPDLVHSALSVKSSSVTTRYLVLMRSERRVDDLGAVCKLGYGIDLGVAVAALAVVVMTVGMTADVLYGESDAARLSEIAVLYALVIPVVALDPTSVAVLTVTGRFGWMAGVHVAEGSLRLGLIVALVGLGCGVGGVVLAIAVTSGGAAVARALMASYELRREGVGHWIRIPVTRVRWLWREVTGLVGWNFGLTTLSGIVNQLPLLWLGRMHGPEIAGFYRLATTIVVAAQYAEAALGRVVSPALMVAIQRESRQELAALARGWTLGLGLPLAVAMSLGVAVMPVVMSIAFGTRFEDAVPSAQVMVGGAIASALFFWVNPFHYAAGRIDLMTRLYVAIFVPALGVAWWVIAHRGLMGMAIVFTAARVALTLALLGGAVAIAQRQSALRTFAAEKRPRSNSQTHAEMPNLARWRRSSGDPASEEGRG